MIYAYDKYYFPSVQKHLANMYELAVMYENETVTSFTEKFIQSKISHELETGNYIYVLGKSSCELLAIVLGIEPKSYDDQPQAATPEYWLGYSMAYAQWYFHLTFKEFTDAFPPDDQILLYFPYHEMDIRQYRDFIREKLCIINPLKLFRLKKNLSQNDLALLAGVPVRNIRAYEQGAIDIERAEAGTLMKMADVLDCKIEDLLTWKMTLGKESDNPLTDYEPRHIL